MQAILYEMRHALGQFRRRPGFTVLAVLILGVGPGATLYMFTVVKAYMLALLPVAKPLAPCTSIVQLFAGQDTSGGIAWNPY